MITYSTWSPVIPAFCRAAEMAIPPRSTAGMSLRAPDILPIGVRAPPTTADPSIARLLLSFRLVKIGDGAVECLGRHADGLRQCRMRVNGEPDIGGVSTHFDGMGGFGDEVAGVGSHDAGAQQPVGGLVEEQLGEAIVPAECEGPAACRPGENTLSVTDSSRFGLGLGQADPSNLRVGVRDGGNSPGVEIRTLPGRYLGRYLSLVHGLVRQHRRADDVADREDVRHVGELLLVDWNEPALIDDEAGVGRVDRMAVGFP